MITPQDALVARFCLLREHRLRMVHCLPLACAMKNLCALRSHVSKQQRYKHRSVADTGELICEQAKPSR
jgi:hypothetical protein